MSDNTEQEDIIDWAIAYRTSGSYPRLLSKDQKRAVRRRAQTIEVDNGEVYVQKLKKRVKVIASQDEQERILNSCHSDPTSGHHTKADAMSPSTVPGKQRNDQFPFEESQPEILE